MNPLPRPVTYAPEYHGIHETIDQFFSETYEYVKEKMKKFPHTISKKSGQLSYLPSDQSDDRVTYLTLNGDIVLCSVMQIRNRFNNVQYTFYRDQETLDSLPGLLED